MSPKLTFNSHESENQKVEVQSNLLPPDKYLSTARAGIKRGVWTLYFEVSNALLSILTSNKALRLLGISFHFRTHEWQPDARGRLSRFSVVIVKLENVGKSWDSDPYLPLQNPVVLPNMPWQPLKWNF